MSGDAKAGKAAVLALAIAIVGSLGMSVSGAHSPHANNPCVRWEASHIRGCLSDVRHHQPDTFTAHARTRADHKHVIEVWIHWADRHCSGVCWWDSHASKSSRNFAETVRSPDLKFTAQHCRYYKFYSRHQNEGHDDETHVIDEPEGAKKWEAGNC